MYKLRLLSDEELVAKSEVQLTPTNLLSKEKCLDSPIFGSTSLTNPSTCIICGAYCENDIGHMGVILLPFPIVKSIVYEDWVKIVESICPVCGNILLPEDIKRKIVEFEPKDRLNIVKDLVKKKVKDTTEKQSILVQCEKCKNMIVPMEVAADPPQLIVAINVPNRISEFKQINPIIINKLLQNFTELDVVGFNEDYHPKNFMTSYIPILPNKLRLKSLDASSATLTQYYKTIIETCCAELTNLYAVMTVKELANMENGENRDKFNQAYSKLYAYYLLITENLSDQNRDFCLAIINHKDRSHFDPSITLLGRLKGKDDSYFQKGIISAHHDVSCRTVLGGSPSLDIPFMNIPNHIANQLSIRYPVYEQNLKFMQQLVAAISDISVYENIEVPKVLFVYRNGVAQQVRPDNAQSIAAQLEPGMRVGISLIKGDFVMESRFPSMREESWSSFKVNRNTSSILTLPISVCPMKMGDFDGDEHQAYVPFSPCYEIEALLLHSVYRQLIAFKDGGCAIHYNGDGSEAPYGFDKFSKDKETQILNYKGLTHPVKLNDLLKEILPEHLNYLDDSLELRDSQLVSEKCNFNNSSFIKYVALIYGFDTAISIMDRTLKLSYDLNRNDGTTLGFEIKYFDKKVKAQVKQLKDELYETMKEREIGNDPHKDFYQLTEPDKIQPKLLELMVNAAKDSNIYKLGFLKKRQGEYMHMTVKLDHIRIDGWRVRNLLAEGSRTCVSFPRFSVDPCAYGFTNDAYAYDPNPVTNFFDDAQTRFRLYAKGAGTADQGYVQIRLMSTYTNTFSDFNGGINTPDTLVELVYGPCGFNPRYFKKLPLLKLNEPSKNKRIEELRKEILEWRNLYGMNGKQFKLPGLPETFAGGFDFQNLIEQNSPKLSLSSDEKTSEGSQKKSSGETEKTSEGIENGKSSGTEQEKIVEELIEELKLKICPKGLSDIGGIWAKGFQLENFKQHEYFFRREFEMFKLTPELKNQIIKIYENLLVDGGEPVGAKAANTISEPLTQASLHAIHQKAKGVSAENLIRVGGTLRFKELFGGATPSNSIITLKLYDDSEENTKRFANKLETFFMNDIWISYQINITAVVDEKLKEIYKNIPFDDLNQSIYQIKMIWNISSLADFDIHPCEIINTLKANYPIILLIAGFPINTEEMSIFILFNRGTKYDEIQTFAEELDKQIPSMLVHGRMVHNCFVSENKCWPGHFFIEANQFNDDDKKKCVLDSLIFDEEIDPAFCKTSNIDHMLPRYGLAEAQSVLYEEFIYTKDHLSETSGVLNCNYNLIAVSSFVTGQYLVASREDLRKDDSRDPLHNISFEIASKFLNDAISANSFRPQRNDHIASAFFGECCCYGDSVSKYTIIEKDLIPSENHEN